MTHLQNKSDILMEAAKLSHDKGFYPAVAHNSYYCCFHIQYLQPIITQYFIDNKSEIWLLFLIAHSKR